MAAPRIGRWEVDEAGSVLLLGNRCTACSEVTFPERRHCPRCRSTSLESARISGPGRLLSWTVVHQAPPSFTTPFAVGYAAFPGDVVVLAPIDAPAEQLRRGLGLRIVEGATSAGADGSPMVSYRFAPTDQEPIHA
jgi:uncharacterized OB-fold protein